MTGGAGYIGSHMVLKLLEAGCQPVIVDALLTGKKSLAPTEAPIHFFNLDHLEKLDALFEAEKFDVVMHFAAFIEAGESVIYPAKYEENNFQNTLTLLNVVKKHHTTCFIFPSSAAIFGEPQYLPIDENHPKKPLNPYGFSKWHCENALQTSGLKFVSLRYFNAAGADPLLRSGHHLQNDSHLIPHLVKAAEHETSVEIYGRDYNTKDGTCVRDYIHVMDLCDAHLLAMHYLMDGGESVSCNLGNERGFSVEEVISTARKTTQRNIRAQYLPRRAGDPATLIADSSLAKKILNWKPKYPDLEIILQHAWAWEQKNHI